MAAMLALLLIAGAVAMRDNHPVQTNTLHVDYLVYTNAADLSAHSSVVVEGHIQEILPSVRVIPDGVDVSKLPAWKAAGFGYMTTDVVVNVKQALAGTLSPAPNTITVTHMGGSDAKRKDMSEAEPLSQPGRDYIFFLERTPEGKYMIVGGPQGRYLLDKGKLVTISDEPALYPAIKDIEGLDVESLKRKIKGQANK